MRKISNVESILLSAVISTGFILSKLEMTKVDMPEPTPIVQRYLDMRRSLISLSGRTFSNNPYTQDLISHIKEDIINLRQYDPNSHEIGNYIEAEERNEMEARNSVYHGAILLVSLLALNRVYQSYQRTRNTSKKNTVRERVHHG